MRRVKFALSLETMEARLTLSAMTVGVAAPSASYAAPSSPAPNSPSDEMMTSDDDDGIDFTGQTLPTNIPYYNDPVVYQMYTAPTIPQD